MNTNEEVQDMVEKFTGMLNHIRDTFVNASSLAETVKALQQQVTQLQSDVQHYSNQIATLDEALTRSRQERDEAQATLAQERNAHSQLAGEHDSLKGQHDQLWREHDKALTDLQSLKHERDEAMQETIRVSDENEALKKQLAEIEQRFANVQALFQPKPTPQAEQPRVVGGQAW